MSRIKKLEQVFEHLANDETDTAAELLRGVMIEIAAQASAKLSESEEDIEDLERDGDMGDDFTADVEADDAGIETAEDEIGSEDFYGEEALDVGDEVEIVDTDDIGIEDAEQDLADDMLDIDGEEEIVDLEDEVEDLKSEIEDVRADTAEEIDELKDDFAALEAEFEKILSVEEVEHDEDFNDDGVIGDAEGETVEESIELKPVTANNKETTKDTVSPVAKNKGLEVLGDRKGLKVVSKDHKGFGREDIAVKDVTKADNTEKKANDLLVKVNEGKKSKRK